VPIPTGTVELLRDADDPDGVTVVVNGVPSSFLDLADPARLDFEYMQQMAAVVDRVAPAGAPIDVVHLGAAGCALARAVDAARPGSHQLAVELDTALAELVRRWFDLPRSPALRIRAGDARAELTWLPTASADVVVRDVFAGDRTPEHVCTREMVEQVARVLRPGGTYLVNCADRPPLALARAEAATLADVFADVAVVAEPALLRGRGYGNVVLAATDRDDLLTDPGLERTIRNLPAPARLLSGDAARAFRAGGVVLRDPDDAA
jgi:spermidine synthase